jgi:hypothetical protein
VDRLDPAEFRNSAEPHPDEGRLRDYELEVIERVTARPEDTE